MSELRDGLIGLPGSSSSRVVYSEGVGLDWYGLISFLMSLKVFFLWSLGEDKAGLIRLAAFCSSYVDSEPVSGVRAGFNGLAGGSTSRVATSDSTSWGRVGMTGFFDGGPSGLISIGAFCTSWNVDSESMFANVAVFIGLTGSGASLVSSRVVYAESMHGGRIGLTGFAGFLDWASVKGSYV